MNYVARPILLAGALVVSRAFSAGQPPPDKNASPYIRTSGDATVSAKPNRARLTIGVVTQASSAQAAASQNAQQTESMLAALRRSLGTAAQLHTSGYSLTPNFSYPRNDGQPVLTGYTASNNVELTTDDLANVGRVIDAATEAGANSVRSLEFQLKDEVPVRTQALREAAQQAWASAQAIAGALGLKVVRVRSAEEGEPQAVRPMRVMAMAARVNTTTPVEPGDTQIHAAVTLTVEVGPEH